MINNIKIVPLKSCIMSEAANILSDSLNYEKDVAYKEILNMLDSNRTSLAAVDNRLAVGIIGAIPQYGITGWELHPLAVLPAYQNIGIGSMLVKALELEVAEKGGVMLYLGSDDDTGTTSLYGADLYDDTFNKLKNIKNTNRHPFTFYEKQGYKIVGCFPDANGIGKPDIWMTKRIKI